MSKKKAPAPLGIITRFVTPPLDEVENLYKIRLQRYKLQAKIQGKLKENDYGNFKRVVGCSRTMLATPSICLSATSGKAFYSGLLVCGSVWACPVCSAKIQERRAHEISEGCFWAYHNGYKAVMMTFTHPHHKGEALADTMAKHNEALRKLRAGEPFKRFKERTGYAGVIRGSEVTYGANGWHFHTHELWFVAADADLDAEEEWLRERWFKCVSKVGFDVTKSDSIKEHGLDILKDDSGKVAECHASDYLAKFGQYWGADRELAKGASKVGAGKTPFELADVDLDRFLEYVKTTKGKCQLFWSRGLKAKCGLVELSDEELAEEAMDEGELLAWLDAVAWKLVLEKEARAELLKRAEKQGFKGVAEWFSVYGNGITIRSPLK